MTTRVSFESLAKAIARACSNLRRAELRRSRMLSSRRTYRSSQLPLALIDQPRLNLDLSRGTWRLKEVSSEGFVVISPTRVECRCIKIRSGRYAGKWLAWNRIV